MHPVRTQVIDEVQHGADAPGQRVGPVNIANLAAQAHHGCNVTDPQHAPDGEHNEHRRKCFARATADGGDRMGISQQEIKQRHRPCLLHAKGNYARIAVKKADALRGKHIIARPDCLCQEYCGEDGKARAFLGPPIFLGSQVLADKGGTGHVETGNRQEGEAFNLGMDAIGSHRQLAEGIDLGLHYNICKGNHGILYARGQAITQDFY